MAIGHHAAAMLRVGKAVRVGAIIAADGVARPGRARKRVLRVDTPPSTALWPQA